MKKAILCLIPFMILIGSIPDVASAIQDVSSDGEIESGAVVCAPGVYLDNPGDCLPAGPSTYITNMAKLGLTFPELSLPASKPDQGLVALPYHYFKLEQHSVPIQSEPGGAETGQGVYYLLRSGEWIPGKGSRIGEYSSFDGLQFKSIPPNAFAWLLALDILNHMDVSTFQ